MNTARQIAPRPHSVRPVPRDRTIDEQGAQPIDLLLERARRGDRAAFEQIVRREMPIVRKLLIKKLGHARDIDDLVQTVFVELCTALGRYRGGSSASTFVRGFARIVALRARRPSAWDRKKKVLDFDPRSESSDPHSETVAREQMRRLQAALARIPEKKRRAFTLWALEGKTPAQIAETTGASVPAVRSRIFYAKKELRKLAHKDPYLRDVI